MQSVLNNDVPGESLASKAKNLDSTMSDVSGQINKTFNSAPISKNDLFNNVRSDLQNAVNNGTITEDQANTEATNWIDRMYRSLYPGKQIISVPDQLTQQEVYKMKLSNQTSSNALFDKKVLTPSQLVTMSIRNGLDQSLIDANPSIKQLTLKQSALHDAYDVLNNGRNADTSIASVKGYGLPFSGSIRKGLSGTLNGKPGYMAASGLALGGTALGGILATKKIMDQGVLPTTTSESGVSQQNTSNTSTPTTINDIPSTSDNFKPDKNGNYPQVDTSQLGGQNYDFNNPDHQLINAGQYDILQKQIANEKGSKQYANSAAGLDNGQYKAQVDSQLSKLEDDNTLSQQLLGDKGPVQAYNKLTADVSQAKSFLSNANPNLFQTLSTYDKLKKSTDPQYASLATVLLRIEGGDTGNVDLLLAGQTPQTLLAKLNTLNQSGAIA
ncbi:MAG: hypothetical protein ACREQ5_20540, partial [Candidatus Dormibacteria bacterium]